MAGPEAGHVTLSEIEDAVERGIRRGVAAVRSNDSEGYQSFLFSFIFIIIFCRYLRQIYCVFNRGHN